MQKLAPSHNVFIQTKRQTKTQGPWHRLVIAPL
jgi:hypothetical protein